MTSSKSQCRNQLRKEDTNGSMTRITCPEKLQVISPLKQFLFSCFGPRGRAKYIQNDHGALMTLSASSQKLFSNLTFASPISQLVASSILQHLTTYSDNGLYMGIVMVSLVEGAVKNINIHHKLCCEVNNLLLNSCLDVMKDILFKIDLSNLNAMLCLVRNIFQSKRSCCLTSVEVNVLSSLVLQTLFSALPDNLPKKLSIPRVEYLCMAGYPVTETKLISGVLLEVPGNLYKTVAAWKKRLGGDHEVIKVALFNNSLAVEKVPLPGVILEVSADVDVEEHALQEMKALSSKLQQAGVDIVGCQRVIHPTLVKILDKMGILAIDRLSIMHIGAVENITGACLLSSMNCDIAADSLGSLEDVALISVLDQQLLHLQSSRKKKVTTVILCHRTETCLQELKHVFSVAYHVASLSINHPEVVPGAGVFEAWLVKTIRGKLPELREEACSRLHCSLHQFNLAAEVFLESLNGVTKSLRLAQAVPFSDSMEQDFSPNLYDIESDPRRSQFSNESDMHGTQNVDGRDGKATARKILNDEKDEECGSRDDVINWDKKVVDLLIVKKNALKMAVEMGNLILSIGAVISSSDDSMI